MLVSIALLKQLYSNKFILAITDYITNGLSARHGHAPRGISTASTASTAYPREDTEDTEVQIQIFIANLYSLLISCVAYGIMMGD
jgi:hypothetical protein